MWAVYLAIVHTWTKVSESPLFKNSKVYTDISTSDTYATFRIQGTILVITATTNFVLLHTGLFSSSLVFIAYTWIIDKVTYRKCIYKQF
jgi:hypothetical protein